MAGRRWRWAVGLALALGHAVLAQPVAAAETWFELFDQARLMYQGERTRGELLLIADLCGQAIDAGVPSDRQPEVWFLRGQALFDAGDRRGAVAALARATAEPPVPPRYHLWYGYALADDQRPTLAVEQFQLVLADRTAAADLRESAVEWLTSLHEPPEQAAWEPTELLVVPGAVIRHPPGEPFAAVVREALTAARATVAERLGLTLDRPVEVVLFADQATYLDYHARRGVPRPAWSTACAQQGRIFCYPVTGDRHRLRQTLLHEYTHLVLRQAAGDRLPPCWLDEGLAVMVGDEFPDYRSALRAAPHLLSLEALTVPSFAGYERDAARLAYQQSRAMVEDLLAHYGTPPLHAFLARLGDDEPVDQAFAAAFGQDQASYLSWWLRERAGG